MFRHWNQNSTMKLQWKKRSDHYRKSELSRKYHYGSQKWQRENIFKIYSKGVMTFDIHNPGGILISYAFQNLHHSETISQQRSFWRDKNRFILFSIMRPSEKKNYNMWKITRHFFKILFCDAIAITISWLVSKLRVSSRLILVD